MSTENDMWKVPINRGMRDLDRTFFRKQVRLPSVCFACPKVIGQFLKSCSHDVLTIPRIKPVQMTSEGKVVLLKESINPDDMSTVSSSTKDFLRNNGTSVLPYLLWIDYDYWTAEEILDAILPQGTGIETPSGFTTVGHIAHFNLRDDLLPFKYLIGQIILDKNKQLRTVVNKVNTIDTEFRNFQMEVLAGEDDLITEQNESDCNFRFDFSKVYWNSRLQTEHKRLISKFMPGQAIADVFAGVGPFAIPAAKNQVIAFANDLNPYSYESLRNNIKINRVQTLVHAYNRDGRSFIYEASYDLLALSRKKTAAKAVPKKSSRKKLVDESSSLPYPPVFSHYVLNLPATAIQFLTAFRGLYSKLGIRGDEQLPLLHVHCFSKAEDGEQEEDILDRLSKSLEFRMSREEVDIFYVRKVAPNKSMHCASFYLPEKVAYSPIYSAV